MPGRERGLLFPPRCDMFYVEVNPAVKVARTIFDQKLATVAEPADLVARTEAQLPKPEYQAIA